MSNTARQLEDRKNAAEAARDNVQILGSQIADVQRKMMDLAANDNAKPSRLAQAIEKTRKLMERKQKEYDTELEHFEKVQQDFNKIQESLNLVREQYSKLEQEHRTESTRNQTQTDRQRQRLEGEKSRLGQRQKKEAAEEKNAARDVTLLQKRQMDEMKSNLANDNRAPSNSRQGRSTFQRAA